MMPAALDHASACVTFSGVIPLCMRLSIPSSADSMPQEIIQQPAARMARSSSGSTKSTRLLQVQRISSPRSRIPSQMPNTWSRFTVKRSAYMWILRTPRLTSSSSSSRTFSGERKRTERP